MLSTAAMFRALLQDPAVLQFTTVASGSRGRGKEIATPEPSDEDDGDSSSSSSPAAASKRVDPTMPTYVSEILMDVLFDAPPATQTQGESTSQVMNLKITF
jgi:hypothetical protein